MISRITCSTISLLLPFCDSLVQGEILFSSAGLEQIFLSRSFPWHTTGAQFSLLEFISILQLRVLQVRVLGTRFPFKTTHQKPIFLEMGDQRFFLTATVADSRFCNFDWKIMSLTHRCAILIARLCLHFGSARWDPSVQGPWNRVPFKITWKSFSSR